MVVYIYIKNAAKKAVWRVDCDGERECALFFSGCCCCCSENGAYFCVWLLRSGADSLPKNNNAEWKSFGSTCDAQTETCKKKKRKRNKKSLAELPAELKHITQRCKKKVTTIAKVTASELAIFMRKKNQPPYTAPPSPRVGVVDVVVFFSNSSRRPGKRKMCGSKNQPKNEKIERCWSSSKKKEKKGKKRRKKTVIPVSFLFGLLVPRICCIARSCLDNLEWFCLRGWQPLHLLWLQYVYMAGPSQKGKKFGGRKREGVFYTTPHTTHSFGFFFFSSLSKKKKKVFILFLRSKIVWECSLKRFPHARCILWKCDKYRLWDR